MTRKQLQKRIATVTMLYSLAVLIGVIVYYVDSTEKKSNYLLFKDLIPLIIAIPAAYIGFCFQRRASYLQSLRQVWSSLITSVNAALQYTEYKTTHQTDYNKVLMALSISIDEVRGVYKNLNEQQSDTGLYPFESLKTIHKLMCELGYGELDKTKTEDTRNSINQNWRNLRLTFLQEFDRAEPTVFDSPIFEETKKLKKLK